MLHRKTLRRRLGRRTATATAVGATDCSFLSWAEVDALLREFPEERDRMLQRARKRNAANTRRQQEG